MKRPFLIVISCTLFVAAFTSCKKKDSDSPAPIAEPTTTSTTKTWLTLDGKQPLVVGHRGYAGLRPDHTISGYVLAIEKGADAIEPDLVMTKDSVLICRHEPMLSGTTNVKDHAEFESRKSTKMLDGESVTDWFASDFTLAEIKTLRAIQPLSAAPSLRSKEFDGQFSIPTFEEVIELAKSEASARGRVVYIYPETKHPTFHENLNLKITDKVLEMLTQAGWNSKDAPVFLQSFEVSNLKYARTKSTLKIVQLYDANDVNADGSLDMTAPYGQPYDFVVSGDKRTYNDLAKDAGLDFVKTYADGIGPWKPYIIPYFNNAKLPTTDLVKRAHTKGLFVHVYTFRSESYRLLKEYNGDPAAEYKAFYDLGVDGVFSDFAGDAVAARK